MNFTDDRILNAIAAILIVISFSVMMILLYGGYAPGIESGHPFEYLRATIVMCTLVSLVIPLLRIAGLVKFPWWFSLIIIGNVYFYAISLFCGFYLDISWWGNTAHAISSMVVGIIVFASLCMIQTYSPGHVNLGSVYSILMLQFIICVAFGGIWEIMEGYTDIIVGKSYMVYGAWDSILDVRSDAAGALIISIMGYFILKKHSVEEVAKSIKLLRRIKY